MALHAGEVNLDPHGATATSINLTFRLLESGLVNKRWPTLRGTRGYYLVVVLRGGVRHSAADVAAYCPVPVAVKETATTGWICLPDHGVSPGRLTLKPHSAITAAAAQYAVTELADESRKTVARAYKATLMEPITPGGEMPPSGTNGLPVTVPLGRLPAEVRGRDTLLDELRRALARKRRRRGGTWVLAGMGRLAAAQSVRHGDSDHPHQVPGSGVPGSTSGNCGPLMMLPRPRC